MGSDSLARLLLTIVFGAILGLETETRENENKGKKRAEIDEKSSLGGLRTYTILSLLGGIAGLLFKAKEYNFAYLTFAGVLVLVSAAYIQNVQFKQAFGLTTEIAVLITFLIGFITTSEIIEIEIILVTLILVAFFLSQKRGFGYLIEKIQHEEISDLLKFGLVSLVVLPLLPNETFTLKHLLESLSINYSEVSENLLNLDLLNPFRIWTIVVVISGISLGGYMLSKLIGPKRGLVTTAFLGGIVSSTSTTYALALKSRKANKNESVVLASAAIIANAASFVSVAVVLSFLSFTILEELILPIAAMMTIGLIWGLRLLIIQKESFKNELEIKYESFSLGPALKFVVVILFVTIAIQLVKLVDGQNLVLFVTSISGISGLDAPTIATTELFEAGNISLNLAVLIFLVTNLINFGVKIIFGYWQGSRVFARTLTIGLAITAIGSLVAII